jgi:cell division protein FtsB
VSSRAYRVAPRRRTAGRPVSRVDWERLGRICLVLVLFAILVLYVNPVVNFIDAWRDARAESEQLAELKVENHELRERAATLEHSDAAERGARMQGMVQPDERSVVICPPEGCERGG